MSVRYYLSVFSLAVALHCALTMIVTTFHTINLQTTQFIGLDVSDNAHSVQITQLAEGLPLRPSSIRLSKVCININYNLMCHPMYCPMFHQLYLLACQFGMFLFLIFAYTNLQFLTSKCIYTFDTFREATHDDGVLNE